MQASIVIVTHNAGTEFRTTLDSLSHQIGGKATELIVVDSDSSDGTRELAATFGARVERIAKSQFNHGATRNLGIEMADGEFVALLTQDALPHDEHWLTELLAPFSDPRVAGVYSRVVARKEATPLVRRTVANDLVSRRERIVQNIGDVDTWQQRPAAARRASVHFNNVSSCVRRGAMLDVPFPAMSFGEDIGWASEMECRGHAIVYQPSSVVEHSHESNLLADFHRHRLDARLLKILFDDVPGALQLARTFTGEVWHDLDSLRDARASELVRYGGYSPCLRGVQALGRWVGAHLSRCRDEREILERWRADLTG
jgi:rhamnosyltransferase